MKLILFFFFLSISYIYYFFFFFSSRRRHTRWNCDWSSDVCSSDLRNPTIVVSIFSHVPDAWEVHVGERDQVAVFRCIRSEERRVGKSVDLGGRRIIKKKKKEKE